MDYRETLVKFEVSILFVAQSFHPTGVASKIVLNTAGFLVLRSTSQKYSSIGFRINPLLTIESIGAGFIHLILLSSNSSRDRMHQRLKVVAAAPTVNNPSMATNLPGQDITDGWKPTLEQKRVLESIQKSGIHSPTLTEIESITKQLQMRGEVEENNVSYWFHNSNAAGGEKEIPNPNAAAGEKEIPNPNAAAAAGEKEIPRKKKTSQLLPSQPKPQPASGESVLWAPYLLTNAAPISATRTQCTDDEVKLKPSLFFDHSCSLCENVERIPTLELFPLRPDRGGRDY